MLDGDGASFRQRLAHPAHLAGRNARTLETVDPLVGRPGREHALELADQLVAMCDPRGVRPVALVSGQV
jgi:hypothetical protein